MANKEEKVRYVKKQGQTWDHHCHWPGCTEQVPPAMWGCRRHWIMLPKYLRDKIWEAYRPGQEVNMTPSREYLKVAHEVEDWILENHFQQPKQDREPSMANEQQSPFLAKYGKHLTTSINKHKTEPVKTGIIKLPGGITRGIAHVKEMYFATGDSGDFWRASGVVKEPKQVATPSGMVTVEGLQTSQVVMIPDPAQDAQGFDEAIAKIQNMMRAIAGEALFADGDGSNIEELCKLIENEHPYVWFSTTESLPDPKKINKKTGKPYEARVWENWHGSEGLEDYVPPPSKGKVNDKSSSVTPPPSTNGATPHKPLAASTPPSRTTTTAPSTTFRDDNDLDSLLKRAIAKDTDAEKTLKEMALGKNMSEEDFDALGWSDIVEFIRKGGDGGSGDDDGFKVGEIYGYAPPNPKEGKPALKVRDCKITKLSDDGETCDLKDMTSTKTYKDVPTSDLTDASSS